MSARMRLSIEEPILFALQPAAYKLYKAAKSRGSQAPEGAGFAPVRMAHHGI